MHTYFLNQELNDILEQTEVYVFDLNGLLIDDEPLQLRATNAALQRFEAVISEDRWIQECVGRHPSDYLPSFLHGMTKEQYALVLSTKGHHYEHLIREADETLLRPGVKSLLTYIAKTGKPCALATSTTRDGVDLILSSERLQLGNHFEFTLCGDAVKHAKPNPEIYLLIRSRFPQARRFLSFEDSEPGVLSAKAAGYCSIACPNRFTLQQDFSRADLVLDSLVPSAQRLRY